MITVKQLHERLTLEINAGNGDFPVAFGDCNKLHLISGYGVGCVRDLNEYYLEEIHQDDQEEDDENNVFIVGE